jgi:hypothetical protein
VQAIHAKIADTYLCRQGIATNGKSAANASTRLSRNMLRNKVDCVRGEVCRQLRILKHSNLLQKRQWPERECRSRN